MFKKLGFYSSLQTATERHKEIQISSLLMNFSWLFRINHKHWGFSGTLSTTIDELAHLVDETFLKVRFSDL